MWWSLLFATVVTASSLLSRSINGESRSLKGQVLAPRSALTNKVPRAVFAHYMVGSMTTSEAVKDIQDAKNVGFDAFALNTHTISSSDGWMISAVNALFDAADANGFKLFFSFDMSWGIIQPSGIPSFMQNYVNRPSYYKINSQPVISTFRGGTTSNSQWDSGMRQPMKAAGNNPLFIPNFDDAPGYPNYFFSNFPVVDGAFSWETAWPDPGNSPANVSSTGDQGMLSQARTANKIYMMPLSSFQFKWLDGNHYYRVGEANMPQRMTQVLSVQPDLVELITWNDAGEGHYVGNFWAEQIAGTPIGDYANGFDHTGWQKIVTPFIKAYKNGATSAAQILPLNGRPTGSLWYRTLLTTASCSSGLLNHLQGRDTSNFAVLLPSSGFTINIYSSNARLASVAGTAGLNYGAVPGLKPGSGQFLQVVNSTGHIVASTYGTKNVQTQSSSSVCNWNYEVVGF